jgi:lipopolysaccharide export system protein LptA
VWAALCSADSGSIDVSAGSVTLDQSAKTVSLKDGVVAKLDGGQITSKTAEARLNESDDVSNPSEVLLSGDVSGCLSDIEMSADQAQYTVQDGSLVLSGRPAVVKTKRETVSAGSITLKGLVVTAENGVTLKSANHTIATEKAIAYFSRTNGKVSLKSVVSGGKVIIVSAKTTYTADKCEYKDGVLCLAGNVVIKSAKNCILADRAKLNTTTGVHVIEGVNSPISASLHK